MPVELAVFKFILNQLRIVGRASHEYNNYYNHVS